MIATCHRKTGFSLLRLVSSGLGLSLAVSCATGPSGNVSGTWDFTENTMSQGGIACAVTGELLLSQQDQGGSRFSGLSIRTATCTGGPAGFDPGGPDNVFKASLNGTKVTFEIVVCKYTGTLTGSTMGGTAVCQFSVAGQVTDFDGTWMATLREF